MADNANDGGKAKPDRIDVTRDVDVHEWAKHFSISPAELIEVVRIVGPMADDVRRHLGK